MTEDEETVVRLLKDYFLKRNQLEVKAYQEMEILKEQGENSLKIFDSYRPELESIYNEFLTKKDRKYTLAYNSLSSEPKFDPEHERIEIGLRSLLLWSGTI
jgi:hypothetical protein